MMKDKFKNEAEEIKIPNKNFKNKIDNIIEKRLESKEEIQVSSKLTLKHFLKVLSLIILLLE